MFARRMYLGSRSSHQHTVKVNHLSTKISQLQLEELLGDSLDLCLVDVHMIRGREEHHAFVQTHSSESAQRVVDKLHGIKLKGMKVSAKLMSESPQMFRSVSPPAEVHQQHTLKVLNLPKHIMEVQLKEKFQLSGKLKVCSVKINQTVNEFNYAYINYGSSEEALAALRYFEKEPPWGVSIRDHSSSSQSSLSGAHIQSGNTYHAPIPTQALFSASGTRFQSSSRPKYRAPLPGPIQDSFSARCQSSSRPMYCAQGSFGGTHIQSYRAPLPTQGSFSGTPYPYRSGSECHASHGGGEAGAQMSSFHAQSTTRPCTVKVSIHSTEPVSSLGITPQHIKTLFSQCGELKDIPSIRNGTPPFAYVNYYTPESAAKAVATLNSTIVNGVRIQVKLSGKQMSQELKSELSIPCDDQLVLRLIFSVHHSELKKIADEHKVTVTTMKGNAGINLTGYSSGLKPVESFVLELQKKVKDSISEDSFSLHCLNIPAFADFKLLEVLQKIEHLNSVAFSVVSESKDLIQLADFVNQVSAIVSACDAGDLLKLTSTPLQSLLSSSKLQQWFWQEDDGSFLPYTADVCQKLNSSFADDPNAFVTFKVGGKEYRVDLLRMTQLNLSTNYERRVKRGAADSLPSWEYQNDQKVFTAYTQKQSVEIEKMFIAKSSSTLTINGRRYEFNFKKMRQVNAKTRNRRHIQRKMAPSSSTGTSIVQQELLFKVRGQHSSLKSATQELKSELARLVVTLTHPLPQESDASLEKCLMDMASEYCVKTEIVDHKDIQIEGVQGYVEKVKLKIAEEILSHKARLLASKESKVLCKASPTNWEPQLDQVDLKVVQPGSSEWIEVETKVHKTLPSAKINKLERIQNFWLWNKYSTAKQEMHERYRGAVNEKELFHGSGQTEPEKLYGSEKGFDFRFSRQGMWGRGTYFAVNAIYSDRYAYSNTGGRKQMLLAKVITGETHRCGPDSSLMKPPEKPQHTWGKYKHALYDSVSGNTNGSDIFVIYDFEKAYPAYLITYNTTGSLMSLF